MPNKKVFSLAILSVFILIIMLSAQNCLAAGDCSGTSQAGEPVKLCNPLTGNTSSKSIPEFLGQIINYAMGIIGSLALVMIIYGGLTWMLSAGNQEQVAKGKQIVIWAALGIAIIFTSYALVRFVITAIGGANK